MRPAIVLALLTVLAIAAGACGQARLSIPPPIAPPPVAAASTSAPRLPVLTPTRTPTVSPAYPTPIPPFYEPEPYVDPEPTPEPAALAGAPKTDGGPMGDQQLTSGEHRTAPAEVLVPDVTALAYVTMDGNKGALLAQFNAHERRAPASLTKIMTALLVLDHANLYDIATTDYAVLGLRWSTLMGVKPGEQLTVREMLYGLMLPSGNDAAIVLARHVAGNEPAFVAMMNAKALELGLWNTHFVNAHGLDSPIGDHYSTAYDMALLTEVAMRNPTFQQLVSTKWVEFRGIMNAYSMGNGNDLLWNYPGADGVKIGYTRAAGSTIVASAVRDGRRIIAVALHTTQRTMDAHRLLNAGFAAPP